MSHGPNRRAPLVFATAGALVTLLPLLAFAQRVDSGTLLKSLPEIPVAPPRSDRVQVQPSETPLPAAGKADTGSSVEVRGFRFTGNQRFSQQELASQLAAYLGTRVSFAGLEEAAGKIRNFYRSRGYFVAAAYLPKQTIENGVVTIAVLEGQLGKVQAKVDASSKLAPELVLKMSRALLPEGTPITEENFERAMLIMGDLPTASARSTMKPGSVEGQADVDVTVAARGPRASGVLAFDNSGACATARTRETLGLSLDNLSGWADSTQVMVSKGNKPGNYNGAINFSLPANYLGSRVGVRYLDLDYRVNSDCAPAVAALGLQGRARISGLWFSHPVIRSQEQNLNLRMEAQLKQFSDSELGNTTDKRVWSATVGVDMDRRRLVRSNDPVQLQLSLTLGGGRFNDATLAAQDALGARTAGSFRKLGWNLNHVLPLSNTLSVAGMVYGQTSDRNLMGSEQHVAGGPGGVRAYPTSSGVGDRGVNASLELRYAPPELQNGRARTSVFGFYDLAWVQPRVSRSAGDPGPYTMSGVGLGLRLVDQFDYTLETSVAHRVGSQPNLGLSGSDASKTRAWISLSKRF